MQKHKKLRSRILSLALAVAMVITALPGTVLAAETSPKTDGVTEGNQLAIDENTEENNKAAARAAEKTPLTITLPKLPDRQQMDPVPKMVTFEEFTYEGLNEGDDGPALLRSKNVRIVGFPTDSQSVIAGRYLLSAEVNNLPGYVVTVKGGDYYVTDKKFDEQPFTVSPEAVYTDGKGVPWFNSPITLTATDKVFPYMKVAGVGAWGPTATLTKEVSSSSKGEQFAFSIDDVGANCIVIYNRDNLNRFNYCLDTLPPEMTPDSLYAYDITDTEVRASALPNDVGSGVKTVYFLCLPEDAPVPTAEEVLSGGNAGTKASSGFVDYRFSGLRGNTRYRFYAVAEDNVGHQTGVVTAASSFSTNRSPLRGTVVLDNMSPKYGDKITATPNFNTENPGEVYYYWYRAYPDGRQDVKIPWAFSSSYTTGIEDVGNKIYSAVRVDNATDYIYSEKSNTVSKADQAPLQFYSYSTEIPYGTNDRRISTSGGTSSESVNYVSSNPNVATVDSATGSITPVSVGDFTVTATKAGGAYYNDVSKTSQLIKVTPKTLYVTGMTATNREYDGTNVVALTGGSLSSIISGDDVELAPFAQGTVSSKSVGTGKAVTVTQISLQGKKADCYDVNLPAGINVDIRPKTVTIEGVVAKDKSYDGTTTASLETLGIIKDAIVGEDVDVQGGTCAFSDKNAGSNKAVTASGFAIAGRDSSNYTLASQPSVANATIKQAELTVSVEKVTIKKGQAMPGDLAVTVAGFATGEDESLSGFVKPIASLNGAVDTTDEAIKAFAVTFTGGNATSNYSFSYKSNAPIHIQTVSVNDEDYVADKDLSKWTNETIVVTPANGYTEISVDKTNWLSSLTIADEGENNLTFYLKKADGTLTESKTIQSKIDKTAPRGEISIGENKWNTFLNSITFGLFFKETQTAEITIKDTVSGADKTYFYLSENALTTAEVEALNSWTEGGSAGVAPDWKGIIYAKLTDKAGNASYISSDGLVLDATAPLIAGATDEGVYCISKELSITDDYLDTVSIDGNTATVIGGKITLYDKASAQTVTATDKAQNTASINITVNAAHTPAADDGDCTTPILCSVCGVETTAAKEHVLSDWQSDAINHWKKCTNAECTHTEQSTAHTPAADDGDCTTAITCSVCDYKTTAAKVHDYKTEWTTNGTNHWHDCKNADCAVKGGLAAHTPAADDGDCTTPILCSVCGVETTAAKVHDYKTEWTTNGTNHWHDCKNAGCAVKGGLAAHTPAADDGDCTTPISCTVCSVETTAAKEHVLSDWQSDAINHWKKCTNAGCTHTEQSTAHTWNGGTVTTPPTHTEDGVKTCACIVCTQTKTEAIAATGHTWSTEWSKDAVNHWHKCTTDDAIKDESAHTFGEWIIDKAATETETGSKHRDCSVCEYSETVTIPVVPHKHTPSSEWSKDTDSHWHNCTANDGERMNEAVHTWNSGTVTTPPTHTQDGVKTFTCTVCGQTKTDAIPKLPSNSALIDDSTGTRVEYEDGSPFDSSIELSVTSRPQAEMDKFNNAVDKAAPGLVIGGLYDVKLLKDGVAIQPDGKVKVSIPLTDAMKAMTNLQVTYIDDNGNVTIIPSEIIDGYLVFVTDHFSYYGVIGKVKASDPGNNNGGENNNGNNNGNISNANSPQTGDSSPVLLFLLMMLASGIALVTLTQKRKIFKHLKK